jgi:N-acetylmuramoyl-L-alanine amidase
MWRVMGSVLLALGGLVMPVSAEHGAHYDVACPTGSAQVVLDPGHGGSDTGAIYATYGLFEKALNLEVAQRTAAILREEYGYRFALTRESNGTEFANSERGATANACNAVVFVEIHLNASFDRSVDYAQTFWGEKEKDLAFSLVMNDALGALRIPVSAVDRFDNGGLLRAKMPSVLVEAVFVSNTNEAKDLANGTRQEGIARAIATGVEDWMRLRV